MNRALAVLTGGAFRTLVIGVVGAGGPVAALLPGTAFAVLGTAGSALLRHRGRLERAVAYVVVLHPLAITA